MKPYPRNNINYNVTTPIYTAYDALNKNSRYSVYKKIDNLDFPVLEIKLTNSISNNETFKGYYYTTQNKETLYQIAKNYYDDESYYWIIAKANGLKNDGIQVLEQGTTLVIPTFSELTTPGGYFSYTSV